MRGFVNNDEIKLKPDPAGTRIALQIAIPEPIAISNRALMFHSRIRDSDTTKIPLLKYKVTGKTLVFGYEGVVPGLAMPLRVNVNGKETVITPTETKQTIDYPEEIKTFEVNRNFYVQTEKN